MASSLAAACSSNPKPLQNRLRNARPKARLIRPPNGACTTSCIPPLSSKKRSMMMRRSVGTAPSTRLPVAMCSRRSVVISPSLADFGYQSGKFRRSRRSFAEPERDRGRRSLGIGHADDARLDAENLPRVCAELHDVAALRLDGEILVEGTDVRSVRLEEDLIVARVRYGSAGGERRDPRTLRRTHATVDAVTVKKGMPASSVESNGGVELAAPEIAIRPGPCKAPEELALVPCFRNARCNDLLGEDVERSSRNWCAVEHASIDREEQGLGLGELIDGQRKHAALGQAVRAMARPPHALEEGRNRTCAANLQREIDIPDVDPQFE